MTPPRGYLSGKNVSEMRQPPMAAERARLDGMGDRSWGPNPTVAKPIRSDLAAFVTKLGPFRPGEILWIHDVEVEADDLDAIAAAISDMPNRPIVICTEPGASLEAVGLEHLKALVARLEEDTNG